MLSYILSLFIGVLLLILPVFTVQQPAVAKETHRKSVVSKGLLDRWKADGNTNDSVGSNSGTLYGATYEKGKPGLAFSFNETDSYFQSSTKGFPTGNSDRTISFKVRINKFLDDKADPHDPLESFFLGYGNFGSAGEAYALGTAGNVLYFTNWGGAIFGPSLKINTWYNIKVANHGNHVYLFLNGKQVADGVLDINTPADTQFYMGRIPNSLGDIRRLNGSIDEIKIYNRAILPKKIH